MLEIAIKYTGLLAKITPSGIIGFTIPNIMVHSATFSYSFFRDKIVGNSLVERYLSSVVICVAAASRSGTTGTKREIEKETLPEMKESVSLITMSHNLR